MNPYCWFDYKTVIVSGASSGIGKGLVKKLINDHCCKVIGIARNEKKMLKLIDELGDKAERYFTYSLFDVSVRENWEKFRDELEEKDIRPDILINNAGILPKFDKFTNYSLDEIEKAMHINFYSCVYSMGALMPLILRSPDAGIVNISSSAALCSLAGTSIYSASKAALKSLTEAVREECRGECYVGLVCPGFTKTDIFSNQKKSDESDFTEKALQAVSTNCDRMVENIVNGIWKKKSNMIFGVDARLMNDTRKFLGVLSPWASSLVIKMAHLKMFSDVFDEENGLDTLLEIADSVADHFESRHREWKNE